MTRHVLHDPEICLTTADEYCRVTPPDRDKAVERVNNLPEGYSKTMVLELQRAYPYWHF